MLSKMKSALTSVSCEYADVFYDETHSQGISYNNDKVAGVSASTTKGARVRVLDKNGVAYRSTNNLDELELALKEAAANAATIGPFSNAKEGLAPVPVVKDKVVAKPRIHPRDVSFEEKKTLLKEYVDLARSRSFVQRVTGSYSEQLSTWSFVNSEGSEIQQEIILCSMGLRVFGKNGTRIESIPASFGYDIDYARVKDRHDEVEKQLDILETLLDAKPAPSGRFEIICNPHLGAIFVHEAFGHLSEGDDIVNNRHLQEQLIMGNKLGQPHLNIIDQGNIPGAPGTYHYDHEGVAPRKTYLIKEGILCGRIHSRATAFKMDGEPTGNFRGASYKVQPITRMSNICIENGESSFEDMVGSIKNGLYLCGGKGGQTMGDFFTFGCQYGYEIKDGKIGAMVSGTNIAGNVYKTLNDITAIGNDFTIPEFGGCGKSRAAFYGIQMLSKSGLCSPHIKISDVVVGG